MYDVRFIGTGCFVPDNIVKNQDLETYIDTSDEWITSRTGISERRISSGETTSWLAIKAAENAIYNANISPLDIDIIIVATISGDNFTPSVACIVQDSIGAKNAFAFDISAACSGFIYALNCAFQFIRNGTAKNVLIIGAEVLSKFLDWNDRGTCVLMGDGAGAAVLSKSKEKGILSVFCSSDGSKKDALTIAGVPVINPYSKPTEINESFLKMNGREIFQFATETIINTVNKILSENNLNIEDIKYIIPHQANIRIIEAAAKKLRFSQDKFFTNLSKYGNTSAASIPIALDEMNRNKLIKSGDKLIMVAFGGGLTFGGALIEW